MALKNIFKNFYSLIKKIRKTWYKFKYLDKTQFNYFIITGFIGTFCLVTTVSYSLFTITKYLTSTTITVAKLNYALSITGESGTQVTVAPGETKMIDLSLTSNNDIKTKYAINAEASSENIKVYYSHNLKNNMSGEIAKDGDISARLVLVNSGSAAGTVTVNIAGGYVKNEISSNITLGYYEQNLTIRPYLVSADFKTTQIAADIPNSDGSYVFYQAECTEESNPVWDNETWTFNPNTSSPQIACDLYFKQISGDFELDFVLKNGDKETITQSVPISGYTYSNAVCPGGETIEWDGTKATVTKIHNKALCLVYFNKNAS